MSFVPTMPLFHARPEPPGGLPLSSPLPPEGGGSGGGDGGGGLAARSDVELLRCLADGDSAALAALYDRHVATLLTMAQRLLGTRSDAEDLVHDLFLEVWLRADSYDASRASVRTWLLVRLRSRALDRLKSAAWRLAASSTPIKSPQETPEKLAAGLNLDPEAELTLRATQTSVRGALRLLTEDEQRLIDLVYVHGVTLAAVAGQMDAPLGTVKSRLNRVLGKLRSSLANPRNEV